MRVVFVIPDERQLATAGVRIRYRRIAAHLETLGHSLAILPIAGVENQTEPGDVLVFSKCHDVRSIALARTFREKGLRVGVDVFDDYYSDSSDARFVRYREWMRAIAPELDFLMCSTPFMARRLKAIAPDLPVHVMHDASEDLDLDRIASTVEGNAERALATRIIDVTWFGIGDNPHFELGLSDLHAYSEALLGLVRRGYAPRLSILTNVRALDAQRLEMIARLPVASRLEEWTERLEREAIARSLVCFLPVRSQSFSVVKSLNRAITTLSGGSQALAAGFPLYDELRPFIYDDPEALVADLEAGALALRRETGPAFADLLAKWGSPAVEAKRLADFLETLAARRHADAASEIRLAIVHGKESPTVLKDFEQHGRLSVASPFTRVKLSFDVRFETGADGGGIVLSQSAASLLREDAKTWVETGKHGAVRFPVRIPLDRLPSAPPFDLFDLADNRSTAVIAMRYRPTMAYIADVLAELFGPVAVTLSELEAPLFADRAALDRTERRDAP